MDKIKEDHVGDLNKKTKQELIELIDRQKKLLNNRKFISRLPDKGEKIIIFLEQLENTLAKRQKELDRTTDLFSKLMIQDYDSDDDENDLSKDPDIMTTLASNGFPEKKITVKRSAIKQKNEESVSTEMEEDKVDKPQFLLKITEKEEKAKREPIKEKFKPFKTASSKNAEHLHHSHSDTVCTKHKFCSEESALFYPMGPHIKAQTISIEESLCLQKQQIDLQKELQIRQAAERLAERMNSTIGNYEPLPHSSVSYREPFHNGDESDEDNLEASNEDF